ncbi:MAG TPA: hypothetical protein VJQ57_13835 [Acidimicrobiia bacterium]|nr:hypothetical protein [Acidimicrobiia bacterium]
MTIQNHEIRVTFTATVTIPFTGGFGFNQAVEKVDDVLRELVGTNDVVDARVVRVKKLELKEGS